MYWRPLLLVHVLQLCCCQELPVLPRAYTLHYLIDMDPTYNYSFFGLVNIEFHAQSSPKSLQVQISDLFILDDQITLAGGNASIVNIDMRNEMLHLELGAELLENVMYTLTVAFFGYGNTSTSGMNAVAVRGVKERTVISTSNLQYHSAFPVLEPFTAIRSTFTISIAHNDGYMVLSNMPYAKRNLDGTRQFLHYFTWPELHHQINKIESNFIWTHFETSKPMTSSMLGFVVISNVELAPSSDTPWQVVPVNMWTRPEKTEDALGTSISIKHMVYVFEKLLQVQYPLPKIDVLMLPDLDSAGLTTWGLLVCSEQDLMYDLKQPDSFAKEKITERLARIISGQWFGHMMVMRTPSQNWLLEGLSQYVGLLISQRVKPDWTLTDNYPIQKYLEYVTQDDHSASFSLATVYDDQRNLGTLAELAATKAYLLLRMNRILFSETAFHSAIISFLSSYLYSAADNQKFWTQDALRASTDTLPNTPLAKFMSSWTLKEGFPALNVTRNYEQHTMLVHQRRMGPMCMRDLTGAWWIPLPVLTKDSRPSMNWLVPGNEGTDIKVAANPREWVIVNYDLIAPLRVNYDETNWKLLLNATAYSYQNIPVSARTMLVSDAFAFAWIGQLNYSIAFDLSNYLRQETSFGPFLALFDALERIDMMLQRRLEYIHFQYYIRYLISNIFTRHTDLKLEQKTDIFESELQSKVAYWACHVHVLRCRERALQMFNSWLAYNYSQPIPEEGRAMVLGVGVALGGPQAWAWVWERAEWADERLPLLLAAVHTTNFELLLKTLDSILNEELDLTRAQRTLMLEAALRRTVNFPVIKNFIYKNTEQLRRVLGTNMADVVKTFASRLRTERDLVEFTKWTQRKESILIEFDFVIRQGKHIARGNIEWDKKYSKYVIHLLKGYQRLVESYEAIKSPQRRRNVGVQKVTNFKNNVYELFMSLSANGSNMATVNVKMAMIFVLTTSLWR